MSVNNEHRNEKLQPLPTEALAVLKHTAEVLEEEKAKSEKSLYYVQGETGKRYYEGIIRGIETALVVLLGESEKTRQKYVRGEDVGGEPTAEQQPE